MVKPHTYNADEALHLAKKFVSKRFPDALCVFIGGSLLRGHGNAYSDVDIVIIKEKVKNSIHKSLIYQNLPIEYSLFDLQTLEQKFSKDLKKNMRAGLHLMEKAHVISADPKTAKILRQMIKKGLSRGPRRYSFKEIEKLRYKISDGLDDLRSLKGDPKLFGLAMQMYPAIEELFFAIHKTWRESGKYFFEAARAIDKKFPVKLISAYKQISENNNPQPLIAVIEKLLADAGGVIWEGYVFSIAEF